MFSSNNYALWVNDDAEWLPAGRYGGSYFDARAAADGWAAYLRSGGTVSAWLKSTTPSR